MTLNVACVYFRLLLQLLAAWTNAAKHIGVQLFKLLLEALKPNYDKEDVSRSIVVIFRVTPLFIYLKLSVHISGLGGTKRGQCRDIYRLYMICG